MFPEQARHSAISSAGQQVNDSGQYQLASLADPDLVEGRSLSAAMPIIRSKMPELDSVRGVAILMVLFYHGFFWSNGLQGLSGLIRFFVNITRFGWLGVNLFFVLSGFLITGILLGSKGDPHYFRKFYIRRALRILPALYAFLLLLILFGYPGRTYLLLSFVYLSNLTTLWGIAMTYPPLWSLAVEEHFYFVWPAVVRRLSSSALPKTLLVIILIEPLARALTFALGWWQGLSSYTWLVADGLAVGSALALYVRSPDCSRAGLARVSGGLVALASFMLLLGAPYGILTRLRVVGGALQLSAANILFGGLLGITLLLGTGRYAFLVLPRVLRFFGSISYGLYLIHLMAFRGYDAVVKVHWPSLYPSHGRFSIMVMRFAIASAAAVLAATLSRRYFEEPFLRLKGRLAA